MLDERPNIVRTKAKQSRDICRCTIPEANTNDLGWRAEQYAETMKVLVFRHQDEPFRCRMLPNGSVTCRAEVKREYMHRTRVDIREVVGEARREILIEQKPHDKKPSALRPRSLT